MVVWLSYVLIPLLDVILPLDNQNISSDRTRVLEKDQRFLIPLYTMWAIDFTMYFLLLYGISKGSIGVSWTSLAYHAVCGAHLGAINATIGHELAHRK